MPLREERHPRRSGREDRRAEWREQRRGRRKASSDQAGGRAGGRRRWRRWLVVGVAAALIIGAVAVEGGDVADRLFDGESTALPAAVPPPAGVVLEAQPTAPPVAAADVGGRLDPAAVRRALAPVLADAALGRRFAVVVSELGTGTPVFRRGVDSFIPASTMKLLTTITALRTLGPDARFSTEARLVARPVGAPLVVLVGGGDPYLMSSREAAEDLYPARADLGTLAARTARALRAQGIARVRLATDASLFEGPRVNPDWPESYLPENVVPPITALWADQGLVGGRYTEDPVASAGGVYASALRKAGIVVAGRVREQPAPAAATEIASVQSAPLAEIVERILDVSDNNAAEVLAHQVGLAVRGEASFSAGARAVRATLRDLGVPVRGIEIHDGSGLSRENVLTAETLLTVLRRAAAPENGDLRAVITGLPVAGFTGSLAGRFEEAPRAALGRVRAKTGTLTGVHGLAGVTTDADGDQIAFVAVADRVPVRDTLAARADLAAIAAALGVCSCGAAANSEAA